MCFVGCDLDVMYFYICVVVCGGEGCVLVLVLYLVWCCVVRALCVCLVIYRWVGGHVRGFVFISCVLRCVVFCVSLCV